MTRLVRSTGVVLCYPLGHEYYRAHRAYVKLADQLARLGFPVMRFDYYGSGDSEGESGHARLEAWLDDIASAADELQHSEPVSSIALGGLRFGAVLAMLAARRIEGARTLVLWDPVDDGAQYVDELAELHARMLTDLERFPRPRDKSISRESEYVGAIYGKRLLDEIAGIQRETFSAARLDDVILLAAANKLTGAAARWRGAGRLHPLETTLDYGWRDAHRIEEALVDPGAIRDMASTLSKVAA